MSKKVSFGYVGCGFVAQKIHLPNFKGLERCDFKAIAEVRQDLGRRVQQKYRIPKLYGSHLELADDKEIEAVGVSGGFHAQGEIARDLLEAGKHVFMEKPMAVSVVQAEKILEASKKGGSRLMVAYMKRFDPGYELFKGAIEKYRVSGELGELLYARNHGFCGDWLAGMQDTQVEGTDEPYPPSPPAPKPPWLPEKLYEKYVGYLQQYIHNVNFLRWVLGGEVEVKHADLDRDGYTGVVLMKVSGVRSCLETASTSFHGWEEHTQCYFKNGWVRASSPPLMLANMPAEVELYFGRGQRSYVKPVPEWGWSYKREAEHFVDCLLSGEEFRSPGEDAVRDIEAIEKIYKAHLKDVGVLG
ncbi:MAG: Gfo/Idh/MocA family oxidoreductase [Thermoproteota archaeon]